MKKAAIAVAIVAAGAAGYWATQNQTPSIDDNPVLDYIPADTLLFSGSLTDFPTKKYLEHVNLSSLKMQADKLKEFDKPDEPLAKFGMALFYAVVNHSDDPASLLASLGIPDEGKSYFYTIGAMPVVKVELDKPQAFWALLDNAEQESGFTHQQRKLGELSYRAYRIMEQGPNGSPMELLFAEQNGMLTITLDGFSIDGTALNIALGQQKPQKSLTESGEVNQVIEQYGFNPNSIFFMDHIEIVKGLTTTDGNELAKQLTGIFALTNQDPLSEIKEAQCATELQQISQNWPRTVGGFNEFNLSDSAADMDVSVVVESRNQVMMTALSKLRGFIPDYVSAHGRSAFSMGFGVDNDNLVSALSDIWTELQTPDYQCEPLSQMQAQLAQQSPAMLGMFTGMAPGVKGISAAILDFELDSANGTAEPKVKQLDAVVSVTALKPETLFNNLKSFAPMFANVSLVENGEPVDLSTLLPIPAELGVKPMLAIKGQNIVLYTPGKAEKVADSLTNEAVEANGFMHFGGDQAKIMKPILAMAELSGQAIPDELKMMQEDGQISVSIDFTANGIVINEKMTIKAK
ncbi:hypothetical protein D5R81_08265 [Parashewanella spongiae]|uniref:DUF945 domain-containing protein n=1 Tax=Parashewanella spongiae TaxID=342950 RepID=A0A3A6TWS0_9GAMM|nr:hypothetical protein [Parashewanella spongiae]MCL1078725.1 hypothetical protein [Parashewanella spongiae]RJY17492.1 hypothetical protein D5R81_08265 [Parashewanella spongiae]